MAWVGALLALIVLFALVVAKQRRGTGAATPPPYAKQPALFSPAERSFLGVLDLAVGKDFRIFGKVRLADVLTMQRGLRGEAYRAAKNRIIAKHVDFVLCRPDDLAVLCAIELNDKSHQRKQRRERDEFLAEACLGAGLPLIMFDAQHAYSAPDVAAKIAAEITRKGETDNPAVKGMVQVSPYAAEVSEEAKAPICPRCSTEMVKRVAKGGENVGKEFWGCPNFPNCREVRPLY